MSDTVYSKAQLDAIAAEIGGRIKTQPIVFNFGGQFLLDPNEINGWGVQGPNDDTNSQDLGDVGASNLNRLAGGLMYPFDVKIKRFRAWHRCNNATVLPWGWVMAHQQKTEGSNTVATTFVLDESTVRSGVDNGAGLRDYQDNLNQLTDINLSSAANNIVTAGDVLNLAVGAPTAQTANYYVQVIAGYIELERV